MDLFKTLIKSKLEEALGPLLFPIIQSKCFIAGGAVLSCIKNQPIEDIDLFLRKDHVAEAFWYLSKVGEPRATKKHRNSFIIRKGIEGKSVKLNIVTLRSYRDLQDVFTSFDLSASQVGYDPLLDVLDATPAFIKTYNNNRVTVTDQDLTSPMSSLSRLYKYTSSKGFDVEHPTIAKLVMRYTEGIAKKLKEKPDATLEDVKPLWEGLYGAQNAISDEDMSTPLDQVGQMALSRRPERVEFKVIPTKELIFTANILDSSEDTKIKMLRLEDAFNRSLLKVKNIIKGFSFGGYPIAILKDKFEQNFIDCKVSFYSVVVSFKNGPDLQFLRPESELSNFLSDYSNKKFENVKITKFTVDVEWLLDSESIGYIRSMGTVKGTTPENRYLTRWIVGFDEESIEKFKEKEVVVEDFSVDSLRNMWIELEGGE